MDFQSEKSFGKLRLRAFQPYHQTLCTLKHVKDVEDNLWYLWHASTYIGFDGMVGKPYVSAFQNIFRIENPLSIKEVMSQNMCVCSFPIFDIFDIHSITALRCIWSIFDIFDIALIFCTVFNAFSCYVSQHLQHQTMCIDTYWHAPFNVHTTDKMTMGDNECEWVASSLSNSK